MGRASRMVVGVELSRWAQLRTSHTIWAATLKSLVGEHEPSTLHCPLPQRTAGPPDRLPDRRSGSAYHEPSSGLTAASGFVCLCRSCPPSGGETKATSQWSSGLMRWALR